MRSHAELPDDAFEAEAHPTDPVALLASPAPDRARLLEALDAVRGPAITVLVRRLAWHRVDGIAWRTLAAMPPEGVDPWLRATLRRAHQQRAAATLAQGLALAEILEALAHAAVPVAVLRGMRAVEWIYKDAGTRAFEDHDLLIRPADESAATEALRRLGFERLAPALYRRGGVDVDLHVDPIGARRRPSRGRLFPVDTEALFKRARPGWVSGGPALLLADEDDVLLMALHLVKHSFDRLVRTADLAHLAAGEGRHFGWEALAERARSIGAHRLVALAFGAAASLGVPAPPALAFERGPGPLESLLLDRVRALRPLPYGGEILMALQAKRLGDRLLFLWDALLPRGEAQRGRFGPADLPRRAAVLLDGAARRRSDRREAS
ncbi:MAG TPA: nucleotidyltransferase family protein [Dongiaceae bacterium]|nr:nucleotidyltransferase family protein [Dongiaceae bacterium]